MKVDFNNLRRRTCIAYDKLCNKLNRAIQDKSFSPSIVIDPQEIQEEMDDLRMMIGALANVYMENDESFKEVYGELYPGETSMAEFNPESE